MSHATGKAEVPSSGKSNLILAACSGSDLLFPRTPVAIPPPGSGGPAARNKLDRWRETFDRTVRTIIDQHLQTEKTELICTDPTAKARPSGDLLLLARKLPPWRSTGDLLNLSEMDMGAVLLEYLRVYECSLREHAFALPAFVMDDFKASGWFGFLAFAEEQVHRAKQISDELVLARRAVERALSITGSIDRVRPLDTNFACLQRSSLDLRNVLGLAADTSACLPRIWDARGSLRDITSAQ